MAGVVKVVESIEIEKIEDTGVRLSGDRWLDLDAYQLRVVRRESAMQCSDGNGYIVVYDDGISAWSPTAVSAGGYEPVRAWAADEAYQQKLAEAD